jgi:hypothetical protein
MSASVLEPPRAAPMMASADRGEVIGEVVSLSGSTLVGRLGGELAGEAVGASIGDLIAMPVPDGLVVALIHSLRSGRRSDDPVHFEAQMMGALGLDADGTPGGFTRGIATFPPIGAPVHRAPDVLVGRVFARTGKGLRLGTLRHNRELDAVADPDRLLGTHMAILGSTGSGKSCAVTVLLRGILAHCPHGHIVLIDPHNEYGRAFGDMAERIGPHNLELPYWLLNFDELAAILVTAQGERASVEQTILRDAVLRAKHSFLGDDPLARSITVDSPTPYRLTDLCRHIDDAMGRLDKPQGAAPYRQLLARIDTLRNDRRFAFMFQSGAVRDTLSSLMARILRVPTQGRPLTTIDISGLPAEVVDVVVSVLFRTIFEFVLWAERGSLPPVLLVCEEAHRYIPHEQSGSFEPSRRAIGRIAKEGRKYGVSLCLVSQRPAELSTTSLSQCGTIFALRLTNERDQDFVRHVMPDGSDWMLRMLPVLGNGEALVVGDGVALPMIVALDRLSPADQPISRTPRFAEAWSTDRHGEEALDRAVQRWRAQER